MISLTPVQADILTSDRARGALGEPVATEVADAVTAGARAPDGTVGVELEPWRDAVSAALREIGPDSVDSTEMEAADSLVRQLGEAS